MTKLFTLLLICYCSSLFAQTQRCSSDEVWRNRISTNSKLQEAEQAFASITQEGLANQDQTISNRDLITIPVVVHVVYKNAIDQISTAQVLSQIDVLNDDYQMNNDDLGMVPSNFEGDIANLDIEFCLAAMDPEGNETNGIIYQQTNVDFAGTAIDNTGIRVIYYTDRGGSDAWDPEHYLNIWVAERLGALGESSFPPQLNDKPEEDGIIISNKAFGTLGTVEPPFHLGRTTTHEVGHYLNLKHLWGSGVDNLSCQDDDELEDTPKQAFTYRETCPTQPDFSTQSCGTSNMYMNFMNYTDDACLLMFTNDQKTRVLSTLNGIRSGLLDSPGCIPVDLAAEPSKQAFFRLSPNPADQQLGIHVDDGQYEEAVLQIWDNDGKIIHQMVLRLAPSYYFNTSHLPVGLYFLNIRIKSTFRTEKFIVTH